MSLYQKITAAILFLMAVFFGFLHLYESPPLNADEGYFIQSATNLAVMGSEGLQLAPGYIDKLSTTNSSGYPLTYTLALWFKIFGAGILEGRILMVILLLAFIVLAYFLSRRLYGNAIALAVLVLLATFPPLYGNGKAVMGEMPGMFFMILSLFFHSLTRTNQSRKNLWLILTGVSAGLFIATKVAFLLFIPALVVAGIIEWRRGYVSWKDLGIGAVSVVVPLIVWLLVKFEPGDSISAVLGFYANPSQVGDITTTVIRNMRALFSDVGPLYTIGMLAIWFVSLCLRWCNKSKASLEEIASFIFALLSVISFTRTAGFYRYLFPAQLIALVFFPNALSIVFEALSSKISVLKKPAVYWICISLLGIFGLYQLAFDSYVADSYGSRKLTDLQTYFDSIPATTTMFFYASEGLVPLFHGRDYYQYLMFFNQDDWTAGREGLSVLSSGKADMIVAGYISDRDKKDGVFDRYVVERIFDKTTIMKRR